MKGILVIVLGQESMLLFVKTNYIFSKSGRGDVEAVGKRHDLAEKKVCKAKDKTETKRIHQQC